MQPSPLDVLDLSHSGVREPSGTHVARHAYREGDLIAGKYLLSYPVGEGAMGSVWHARDIFLGTSVALKLLRGEHRFAGPQRDYLSERLTREATAIAGIRNPAIVRVLDFGSSSWNDPYLAMELLDGESLGDLLARSGQLIPEYAVQIILPVADGLAAAHEQGVVHRDLKPENLFLAIDGRIQPKLIDFGLAKLTHGQVGRKLSGTGLLGTPDYMSPEQALELPTVDHRSDVWSFCVVLYEALSGTLPFAKSTFAETLCALLGHPPAPLTAIGIDPALWAIVERGLRKAPAERWQSMRELGAALANWLVSRGVHVDVTGAELHGQWPILELDASQEPAPSLEAASLRSMPFARRRWRSGIRLRRRWESRLADTVPGRPIAQSPRPSSWRAGLRMTLSGAIAAGLMLVPAPPVVVAATAVANLLSPSVRNGAARSIEERRVLRQAVIKETDVNEAPVPDTSAR
jgi:serine/threonine-protein kinase